MMTLSTGRYRMREQKIAEDIRHFEHAVERAGFYRDILVHEHLDALDAEDHLRPMTVEACVCAVLYHLQIAVDFLIYPLFDHILLNEECDLSVMSAIDKTNALMKFDILNDPGDWASFAYFTTTINAAYRVCDGRFSHLLQKAETMLAHLHAVAENLRHYAIRAEIPMAAALNPPPPPPPGDPVT